MGPTEEITVSVSKLQISISIMQPYVLFTENEKFAHWRFIPIFLSIVF